MIFYYKPSGKVAMYTDNPIEQSVLSFLDYTPTASELDLIQQNYDLFVKNGQLIISKSQGIIHDEDIDAARIAKAKIKQDLKDGTTTLQGLAALLLKIL